MQSDRTAPASLSADEFFALVETSLTAPMAALGYHRIHGSVNDQPGSRGRLTSSGGEADEAPFVWFEFGYEAGSDEVTRLVGPRDPQSEEEWWVKLRTFNRTARTRSLGARSWRAFGLGHPAR
jgi:hypothetical protein